MRHRADDAARVEHSGELNVERVARLSRDLLYGIEARDRLANCAELRVFGQWRRLVGRHVTRHFGELLAGDAIEHRLLATHRAPPFARRRTSPAASNVALKMLG